jgi:hypothetical protein
MAIPESRVGFFFNYFFPLIFWFQIFGDFYFLSFLGNLFKFTLEKKMQFFGHHIAKILAQKKKAGPEPCPLFM